jgi:hypothetical protein
MTAADLLTPDLFNGRRVRLTAPHPDDKPIIAAWSQITEYGRLMFYGSPAGPITTKRGVLQHEWEAARQTW